MINFFTFDGKSSREYGVYISGSHIYNAPERDVSTIEIPGRNGNLTMDNGRYKDITLKYPAFIFKGIKPRISGLRNFLLSHKGFYRLEDTYHPSEFRLARYAGGFEAQPNDELYAANFELSFDCYPQRFLKVGEAKIVFTQSSEIFNEYEQDAKPLLRVYGTGTVTINGISIVINTANEYTDIDCDLEEAYKDTLLVNCNANIQVTEFPVLSPGINKIILTGVTKLEIIPRWWIL